MIKNICGCDFKYEDNKMYRFLKTKWSCLNDNKPNSSGYIHICINKSIFILKQDRSKLSHAQ